MKKIFTLFVIAICFAIPIAIGTAQSNALFAIRNNTNNVLINIYILVDGENNSVYVIGTDYLLYEHFLIKLDSNGTIVWHKKLPSILGDTTLYYYTQLEFYNNELYILGAFYHLPHYQTRSFLAKVDLNGNLLWSKLFYPNTGGAHKFHRSSMAIKSNSEIIIAQGIAPISVYSLNSDGTTNWTTAILPVDSYATKGMPVDITVRDNGDIMGCTNTPNKMAVFCIRNDGALKWGNMVVEMANNYTYAISILEINNNKFLICGSRLLDSLYGGFYGFIDSTGSFLDFRMVNELYEITTGILLNDGNILLQGYDYLYYPIYITINDLGNVIESYQSQISVLYSYNISYNCIIETPNNNKYFANSPFIQKIYDFSSLECLNMVSQPLTITSDDRSPIGNFVTFTGGTVVNNPNMQLVASNLKLEYACAVTIGIEENNASSINIFPTALHNYESIFVNNNLENTVLDYRITDMNGKMVLQNKLMNNSIPVSGLSGGMYIIQFGSNGNLIHTDKFVVVE